MRQKNFYFYTNLLAWGLVLFLIGNHVFGWTTPTATPPSSNLPAPINVSSIEQTKAGNLIIEGVLRLGQFATSPSGAEGGLYYNTTEDKVKVYTNTVWADLGGTEPGQLSSYTTAQRDALSPTQGQQIYNTTENKVQVYVQGAWKTVAVKLALAASCSLDGDCDSTYCVDGVCCETTCSGTVCQTCGALSSAGIGYCGYVNNSTNDPRSTCTTAAPGAADSCKSPNCSGTGYTCGYLSEGEQGQPACQRCPGGSYNPANIANASLDTEGSNLCTAEHYRCNGSGSCTAPLTPAGGCQGNCGSWSVCCPAKCETLGYPGCYRGYNAYSCGGSSSACTSNAWSCQCSVYVY